jgi:hypothetical protein
MLVCQVLMLFLFCVEQSCIKVALDFVSPENFSQCIQLSNEIRLLPKGHGAKEDKLEVCHGSYAVKNMHEEKFTDTTCLHATGQENGNSCSGESH